MTYTANYGWGPGDTPKTIQYLIWVTCISSVLCALLNNFFLYYLGMNGPQQLFSLSWGGLSNWYIWQPLTYLFLQSSGSQGISIFFLIELLFNMYILWIMGTGILERVGANSFVRFYFVCGIITGIITLLFMPVYSQYAVLAGSTPIILAIMFIWAMIHPESELLLFFILPVKAKWIIAGIIAGIFLINLSHLDFLTMTYYYIGILVGYFYAVCVWGLSSPFKITHPFDEKLASLGSGIRQIRSKKEEARNLVDNKAKIFDFFTGKAVMDDDKFMDTMLEKISLYGEHSLTWSERNRMNRISDRKSKHK
jgi:membrane associated rhomboid family serine protease